MRQIKFRAWDKKKKQMFVPSQIDAHGTVLVDVRHEEENGFGFHVEEYPNPYELMQFTGLLDKNGKEIYEGDIVRFGWVNNLTTHEVVFNQDFLCWDMVRNRRETGMREFWSDRLEIIGNIYQNPELIAK